jgi:hypothetical protein
MIIEAVYPVYNSNTYTHIMYYIVFSTFNILHQYVNYCMFIYIVN